MAQNNTIHRILFRPRQWQPQYTTAPSGRMSSTVIKMSSTIEKMSKGE